MAARLATNAQCVAQAEKIQENTKGALLRIQQLTTESVDLGTDSITELRKQGKQLDRIYMDACVVKNKLSKTKKLQNTFGRWGGRCFVDINLRRRTKKDALEEANAATTPRRVTRMKIENRHYLPMEPLNMNKSGRSFVSKVDTNARVDTELFMKDHEVFDTDYRAEEMGHDSLDALGKLKNNETEIESMINEVDTSLDRLVSLSLAMKEETRSHEVKIDKIDDKMDESVRKMAMSNAWIKRRIRA